MRFCVVPVLLTCLSAEPRALAPEDLFATKNITTLALSPDGQRIAFVVREASLSENKYKSSLWLSKTSGIASSQKISDDAHSPQWSPDGKKLAYIAPKDGRPQIIVFDPASSATNIESSAATAVLSFQWSPDGLAIAFLAREAVAPTSKNDERRGAVIDKLTFNLYKLMGNDLFIDLARPVHLNLFRVASKSIEPLIGDLHVDGAVWAPDGKSLAVVGRKSSELGFPASVYLYSLATKKATPKLQGIEQDHIATLEYSQPTWSPDGSELAVVEKASKDRWASSGTVGIYSIRASRFRPISDEDHLELYAPRFFWYPKLGLVLENTVQASTQLFELSRNGNLTALTNLRGDNASFSFSSAGDQVAFVHNNVQRPPEIYVASFPFSTSKKITSLNGVLEGLPAPLSERVRWTGAGGIEVDGLLLKPANYAADKRYPLVVMVHGGPGVAIKDSFEPYSLFSQWAWPYPFRIFTERGYLVFFPNYRGTGSYGKSFRMFQDIAGEPAEDIVTGVENLIRRGDVDPDLVGILGHSHGAWLGPYVLTHHKTMFKAASFAEGALNAITQYGLLGGWLNLYTHEFYNPGTPYDNLRRYVEISPVFAMKGMDAPTLLEFGQKSLAMLGLESLTALWREGVPHEMVVYPGEGHNLASPEVQLESMHRNLDWFDYWMLGKQDPAANKRDQYARWARMAVEMKRMRESRSGHP